MKTLIYITLSAFMLSGILASCKKGEDDPFLSLRTRRARLAGSWTVSIGELTTKNTGTDHYDYTTTSLNGTSATYKALLIENGDTINNSTTNFDITITYIFEKDGSYKKVQTGTGSSITEEGSWSFIGKSKDKELKNKEAIMLTMLKSTTVSTNPNSTYVEEYKQTMGNVYVISRLANKELEFSYSSSAENPEMSYTSTESYVLTQD